MTSLRDQLMKLGLVEEKPAPEPPPPAPKPRINQIVKAGALANTEGRKRFYFEGREGRVSYLEVDDQTATKLSRGDAVIVESPSGQTTVVDRATGDQVAEAAPEWVRFRR